MAITRLLLASITLAEEAWCPISCKTRPALSPWRYAHDHQDTGCGALGGMRMAKAPTDFFNTCGSAFSEKATHDVRSDFEHEDPAERRCAVQLLRSCAHLLRVGCFASSGCVVSMVQRGSVAVPSRSDGATAPLLSKTIPPYMPGRGHHPIVLMYSLNLNELHRSAHE